MRHRRTREITLAGGIRPDPRTDGPCRADPIGAEAPDFASRFRRLIAVIYPKDLGRPWRDSEI
ncbi:hypothetical protein ABZ747_28420, partial [Kitasatospora cineracea]